jgi:BCD family chlorophyll transporter-like MFS transporter
MTRGLSWLGIARLGLVQAGLGAVVVLTTSTMNRVMVVELAMPAILPGMLIAWHYLIQVLRPRMGHGSDIGGRRTPWIVGGMAVLAAGGVLTSLAVALMAHAVIAGVALAVVAFSLVGLGAGAAGTSLLVLLAGLTAPARRPAAATLVWLMMFAGFVVTAITASVFLSPFSLARLVKVTLGVCGVALALGTAAVWNMERDAVEPAQRQSRTGFAAALRQVWAEPASRRFGLFVFFAMLAYSAQELILDPFAGQVFRFSPGQSTQLSGLQHGGALAGMLAVAAASLLGGRRLAAMRNWTVGGCVASALAALLLAVGGLIGPGFPLREAVVVLGIANGSFAVSAIGAMMQLVSHGDRAREGVRMGVWGAAQAVAFGLGGLAATGLSDIARSLLPTAAQAYAVVFVAQAALFLAAAGFAVLVFRQRRPSSQTPTHHGARLAPSGGV